MLSIRTRTLLIVSSVALILLTLIATVSYFQVTRRLTEVEIEETGKQVRHVRKEVDSALSGILTAAADWAIWDDTYRFVEDLNPEYIASNIVDPTFISLRLHCMLFFNQRGELVYGRAHTLNPTMPPADARVVAAAVARNRRWLAHPQPDSRASGILMVASTPYLVAAVPIVTSQNTGPIHGTLVFGRALDADEVARIGEVAYSAWTMHAPDSTALRVPARRVLSLITPESPIHAEPLDDEMIVGYGAVNDLDGSPALIIEVTRDRQIYQSGVATWRKAIASTVAVCVVIIVLLIVLLDRFVLRPLKSIAAQVHGLADTPRAAGRISYLKQDEIGMLAGAFNAMLDALDRYHARQISDEKQYRAVVEDQTELIGRTDSQGAVVFVNGAFCRFFHKTAQELTGRSIIDLLPEPAASVLNRMAVDGGWVDWHEVRHSIHTAAGEERRLQWRIRRLTDESSGSGEFQWVGQDRTDQIKAEEALALSEARYRNFFEEDITGDFLSTVEGRIVDCNPAFAAIFGFDSVAQITSEAMTRFYPSVDARRLLLERLQRSRQLRHEKMLLVHRSGRPLHCIANLIGQFDAHGRLVQIKGYLLDDTQRVLLEKDLRQAQKMETIGTLAGGIAHDFNNILSAIMGCTEVALQDLPPDGPAAGLLRDIMAAAVRAKELVRQILVFSRQSESQVSPIDLLPIVQETLKLLRATLPSTIIITMETERSVTVMADPAQIHQIVMNLCTNAGQAMKSAGGKLTVALAPTVLDQEFTAHHPGVLPGHFAHLMVMDTGIGISPEIIDRIFDPFFTTQSKAEGTGMGLSVVHGAVIKLGGIITVFSDGRGSRFDVYLPSLPEPAGQMEPEPQARSGGSASIVYVDDDELQIEIGSRMLEHLGYRVTGFTSSTTALAYIEENVEKIDLVISDVTMPELGGIELSRCLLEKFPRLPIILSSGYEEEVAIENGALSAAVRGYLLKPVSIEDFSLKVKQALDAPVAA